MLTQHVEKKHVDIIKHLYEGCCGRVRLETAGPLIPIKRGVRQGDPQSFIAVLELIMRKINFGKAGININGNYIMEMTLLGIFSENTKELPTVHIRYASLI